VSGPNPQLHGIEGIVIGTSAGGVEALSIVLPALPRGLRASVFVVIHLPRERSSMLVDIFADKCVLAVREAEDKEEALPGTIYFAPPDYHLLLNRGPQLALSVDDPVHHSRPSIDVLFESAADVYHDKLLGIILTGANEDGADGLLAVRRGGGVTVVQEPEGAHSPLMALSALKRTPADFVLSLEQIAGLLTTLVGQDIPAPGQKET
jgi:two-component system, chemotaxis family, protein-glutamate methylesterase/glutaminase